MRIVILVLLSLLAVFAAAQSPKAFIVEGGTAVGEKPIKQTLRIEANDLGQITRVSTTAGRTLNTDFDVTYDGDSCHFEFDSLGGGGKGVKIKVDLSWKKTGASGWEIILKQSNDVPESKIGKTVYPAKIYHRTRTIVLQDKTSTYSWTDVESSDFGTKERPSSYVVTPGKSAVHEVKGENPDDSYRELMDGKSSDSSPITSARMVYTKLGNKVQGRFYWAMEPIEWDGGKSYVDGGTIVTSGDSLNTPSALTNVINFSLVSVPMNQDVWDYFGPTLFGIPIK